MQLLDGKIARAHYTAILKEKIAQLSIVPCLLIIQVGDRSDSTSFIKSKKKFATEIGTKEIHINLDEKIRQNELIEIIKKYNNDKTVQGIIVQLPLPMHLNVDNIINNIDSGKDVDGLTKNTKFTPATARGISELFDFYSIDPQGKKVTILGKSKLVGIPIAEMCMARGAIVTVCHSQTENIQEKTKDADIVIVAIGRANHIDLKYINKGQIVIDVGINRVGDKIVGDVDFDSVKDIVSMITPVPGGVGQMTVLSLFENLVDACYNLKN